MLEVTILNAKRPLTKAEFDFLTSFLSIEKYQAVKRLKTPQEATNTLLGAVLSQLEISRFTGFDMKYIDFTTNVYGKPFVRNIRGIHFNVSHSEFFVVCATSSKPVGIDIEVIRPINLKIANRFFTTDEIFYIMKNQNKHHFIEIWTKKESFVKLKGKGFHIPLTSFSVFNLPEKNIFYYNVFNNEEAICYVCSSEKVAPIIRIIDTNTLINCLLS